LIEEGIQRFSVTTPRGEEFKILRPTPVGDDPWGILAPLRELEIGGLIPIVPGETMSHALHGNHLPLLRVLGRPPHAQLKQIKADMTCRLIKTCITADRAICFPCQKMPHCYEPPGYNFEEGRVVETVLRAWVDGRYVVVVEGPEFSF